MEGELQRVVGRNVRLERTRRSLSQEQFADLLGIHRTLVGAIERGERNLTLRTVERLGEALGVAALRLLVDVGDEGALRAAAEGGDPGDLRHLPNKRRPRPR